MVATTTRKRITRSSSSITSVSQQNSANVNSKSVNNDNNKNSTKKPTKKSTSSKANKTIDQDSKNHNFCDACNGIGRFICCDSCPSAFHFSCLNPPMNAIDVDNWNDPWYCNECLYKQKRKKPVNKKKNGGTALFENLSNDLERKNPIAFCLPEHIRNYFEGVSTGRNGVYVDATTVKAAKLKNGHYEKQDYFQLKDDHNNYIFCYHCRKTAYKNPMVACDFCKLHWHFDCLTPPMTIPPHPTKKWMCPCHAEHAEKIYQRIPRKPRADPNISYPISITPSPSTSTTTTSSPSTNISTGTSDTLHFSILTSGFHHQSNNNSHQISNTNNNNITNTKHVFLHDKSQHRPFSNDFKLNFISTSNNNNNNNNGQSNINL